MAVTSWKNPFKFVATKPQYKEAWEKICSTYMYNIDNFSVKEVRIYSLLFMAETNWDDAKQAFLSESSMKKMLAKAQASWNIDQVAVQNLREYQKFLPDIAITTDLFIAILASSNPQILLTSELFVSVDKSDTVIDECTLDYGTIKWKINNRDYVLNNFREFITIVPDNQQTITIIYGKAELGVYIFESILKESEHISEFRLERDTDVPF